MHNNFILVLVTLILNAGSSYSQDIQGMFMYQVDENKYEKKSYDKNGSIISKQIIEAGMVQKKGSKHILPVKIISYNEKGKLKDTYETSYSCDPSSSNLFMHVFPLSDKNNNTHVSVNLLSGNDFYPQGIKVNQSLPDISFTMDIEGGVLGFFGANSKVKISDRKIFAEEEELQIYTIKEKIEIKAYMFGINIKTINYTVEELFNAIKGIIKQEYKERTGEYFTITLIQS